MALLVPNEGKLQILDLLNGGDFPTNVRLGLFQGTPTIDKDIVLGDLTPADFSGYSDATPAFDPAIILSDKGVIEQYPPTDFGHNGGATANDVTGYYVWDDLAGVLLWLEAISPSIHMENNGDTIELTARLTCDTE